MPLPVTAIIARVPPIATPFGDAIASPVSLAPPGSIVGGSEIDER